MYKLKDKNKISVKEIEPLLGNINLIDIREVDEYKSGHIPTAKNIVMDKLLKDPNKYLDRINPAYIVCRSGRRSEDTCNILSKKGFNVIDVTEGTIEYEGVLEYSTPSNN